MAYPEAPSHTTRPDKLRTRPSALAAALALALGSVTAQAQNPAGDAAPSAGESAAPSTSMSLSHPPTLDLVSNDPTPTPTLLTDMAAGQPLPPGPLTEADAQRVASELTARLRQRGYPIAQALWLPRDAGLLATEGRLRLHVFLGQLGKVSVRTTGSGYSGPWIETLVQSAMCPDAGPGQGCVVTAPGLERATLLLGSLPGVSGLKLSMSPEGVQPGQTALEVDLDAQRRVLNAALTADNHGLASTGRERYGFTLIGSSVLRDGDTLALQWSDTRHHAIATSVQWNQPLGVSGLRLATQLSRSQFSVPLQPGTDVNGVADGFSVGLSHPLELRYDRAVNAQWDIGYTRSKADIARTFTFQDRGIPYTTLSLSGHTGARSLATGTDYASWGLSVDSPYKLSQGSHRILSHWF